jgi:hypothetical protein
MDPCRADLRRIEPGQAACNFLKMVNWQALEVIRDHLTREITGGGDPFIGICPEDAGSWI